MLSIEVADVCAGVRESALWTELDGQFILMNVEDGAYFEVAGVGEAIWRMLSDAPRSEAEIVDHLVATNLPRRP